MQNRCRGTRPLGNSRAGHPPGSYTRPILFNWRKFLPFLSERLNPEINNVRVQAEQKRPEKCGSQSSNA
jgi:hypothetical protein